MTPLRFHLERWAAWAPGLETPEAWTDWAATDYPRLTVTDGKPPLRQVPPLLRRRLSRLSRLALQSAYDCLGDDTPPPRTVFASRHGEIHRTLDLLRTLAQREPLSPMGFSLSVHNTASGLYGIASHNTQPSTAVAAGRDTLVAAIREALVQSTLFEQPVLVAFADEPLPEPYADFADETTAAYGLALLIAPPTGRDDWCLTPLSESPGDAVSAGLQWLRQLTHPEASHTLSGERCHWSCRRV